MPVLKKGLLGMAVSQSKRYPHDILWKCILGQDNVSHTRMIVPPFLVSELCPFESSRKILCTP